MIWSAQPPHKVATIGECMIEMAQLPARQIHCAYGGDTLNTAVYLARLATNTDTHVHFVTRVGRDPLSVDMVAGWQDEGIDTGLVEYDTERLPGLYYIATNSEGERRFYYWRNDSAASAMLDTGAAELLETRLAGFDTVYTSGITLAILPTAGRHELLQLMAALRRRGVTLVFDSNYRERLWSSVADAQHWLQAAYQQVDVLLTSLADERAIYGDEDVNTVSKRVSDAGITEFVIKNGSAPCLAVEPMGVQTIDVPTVSTVIDTTAAGDSFNAAYIAARLQGFAVNAAVTAAQRLAARVIAYRGAIIPRQLTPTLGQIT